MKQRNLEESYEIDKQVNSEGINREEDNIPEDPWEAEIRELERARKGERERERDIDAQNSRGTCEEEELEQDAISREVLRDIRIKEGNDWDLGDTIEEQRGNQKQIERHSKAYRKIKPGLLGHVIRADNADPMRQVSLKQGSIKDKEVGTRKVGKPKLD